MPNDSTTAELPEDEAETKQRETKNALSFLGRLAGTGGYKLRAVGYYTMEAIKLFGLAFGDPESWQKLEQTLQRDHVHALMFIQGAPIPEVERAARRFTRIEKTDGREAAWEDFVCDIVAPFLATLGTDAQVDMLDQFEQMSEAGAAIVEARPPKGQKRERPDPNS